MSSIPTELAGTIQSAHINPHPDTKHDINPSTAAQEKETVSLRHGHRDDLVDEDEEDIPYSVLQPASRKHNLPPLPDLRFEQSYLKSIAGADTWWKVLLITTRDQVWVGDFSNLIIADSCVGSNALDARPRLQPVPVWLAELEQERSPTRQFVRSTST